MGFGGGRGQGRQLALPTAPCPRRAHLGAGETGFSGASGFTGRSFGADGTGGTALSGGTLRENGGYRDPGWGGGTELRRRRKEKNPPWDRRCRQHRGNRGCRERPARDGRAVRAGWGTLWGTAVGLSRRDAPRKPRGAWDARGDIGVSIGLKRGEDDADSPVLLQDRAAQQGRALHELLSCLPHRRGRGGLEHQRDPAGGESGVSGREETLSRGCAERRWLLGTLTGSPLAPVSPLLPGAPGSPWERGGEMLRTVLAGEGRGC